MPAWLSLALLAASSLSALVWLAVLLDPTSGWRLRPIAEEEPAPPEPELWPSVRVIIPAHDEESLVADSLPTVLAQDYPGDWAVVFVDERSTDSTAELAQKHVDASASGPPLTVVRGQPLPPGWIGKVWASSKATGSRNETNPTTTS